MVPRLSQFVVCLVQVKELFVGVEYCRYNSVHRYILLVIFVICLSSNTGKRAYFCHELFCRDVSENLFNITNSEFNAASDDPDV